MLADSVYGDARGLIGVWLEEREQPYVVAVSGKAHVWVGFYQPTVSDVLDALREGALPEEQAEEGWARLRAGKGSKGDRVYDWIRLELNRPLQEGFARWLLVRRDTDDPAELTAYVVFAPQETSLIELAKIAGSRWQIEAAFEAAKGEVGLDHYEIRSWDGWYRHITLALCAHAFLSALRASGHETPKRTATKGGPSAGGGQTEQQPPGLQEAARTLIPLTVPEVRRLLWRIVLERRPSLREVLGWSVWRRRHQAIARHCHYKTRAVRHAR